MNATPWSSICGVNALESPARKGRGVGTVQVSADRLQLDPVARHDAANATRIADNPLCLKVITRWVMTRLSVQIRRTFNTARREGGPYYRWSYNDASRKWQAGRVLPSAVSPKAFAATAWKAIPGLLKRSIADHYQD